MQNMKQQANLFHFFASFNNSIFYVHFFAIGSFTIPYSFLRRYCKAVTFTYIYETLLWMSLGPMSFMTGQLCVNGIKNLCVTGIMGEKPV